MIQHLKTIIPVLLIAAISAGCEHKKSVTDDGGKGDFSGTYCIQSLNSDMVIVQTGDSVAFTIQAEMVVIGTGKISGDTLHLEMDASGSDALTCMLVFSTDRQNYSGFYQMTDSAGTVVSEGILQGGKGACPKYDVTTNGIPRFVTSDLTELSKIERISKFRSGEGHSYADHFESCRSMKHYYGVYENFRENRTVPVYSPAAGTIQSVSDDGHGASIGLNNKQVLIRPNAEPAFILRIFHCDLISSAIAEGKEVQAGELIGHARLFYEDLGEHAGCFDIAVWVNTPEGMRLVPFFDAMTDAVFNRYAERGVSSRQEFVITKEERDADPLECNGEWFANGGNLENWVTLSDPSDGESPGDGWPAGDIILGVPYADRTEFKFIHPGYSASADSGAPWGFLHQGLDLIVAQDSARVIAPADGVVEEINIYQNEHNALWQVNLRVRYNEEFVYHLLYEPRARTREEDERQRAAIPLAVGQKVKQGDPFGVVYDFSPEDPASIGSTLHFDIWKGEENICPAPYFTAEAYAGMLALLRAMYPEGELCYP
ncbi:hypothetical protein JW906_09440 [bacterium]|nr:hypothetical protein [bacterium]